MLKRLLLLSTVFSFLFIFLATQTTLVSALTTDPVLVKDINPSGDALTAFMGSLNNEVYFWADDGVNGVELWKSDGTEEGTNLVKDINPSGNGNPNYYQFKELNGYLYFHANDGVNGIELWKTDGTDSNTTMVKNINTSGNSVSSFATIEKLGNELLFPATDGTNGIELWKTDGTEVGTVLVKDINPAGNSSPMGYGSGTDRSVVFGTKLYFLANDGTNGSELWVSDGTELGTTLVKNIHSSGNSNIYQMVSTSNLIFFNAQNSTNGRELWVSDGTEVGTIMVEDILSGASGSDPYYLEVVNDTVYFSADNGINGVELWKSDGTALGTYMVKDIYTSGGSWPEYLSSINDTIYFTAYTSDNGVELWKSDGTEGGTTLVKDINPGSSSSSPQTAAGRLISYGEMFYFHADNGTTGYELWISDGTEDGTISYDINAGANSSTPNYFIGIGDDVFFKANDGLTGSELWKITSFTPTPTPSNTPTPTSSPASLIQVEINGTTITRDNNRYDFFSNNNIKFTGITTPFSRVVITVNSDPKVCETTADAEGYYECTFPYIEDGVHTVSIVATTPQGDTITFPSFILGINALLVPTGSAMYMPIFIGLLLIVLGAITLRRKNHFV